MSLAQIEALYTAAVNALDNGDYDTATQKAIACQMRLATTPDIDRMLGAGGQQRMAWTNAGALDRFIAECRKLKSQTIAAISGPQQTKVVYGRPESLDCY
jgi:hypothetical protein